PVPITKQTSEYVLGPVDVEPQLAGRLIPVKLTLAPMGRRRQRISRTVRIPWVGVQYRRPDGTWTNCTESTRFTDRDFPGELRAFAGGLEPSDCWIAAGEREVARLGSRTAWLPSLGGFGEELS